MKITVFTSFLSLFTIVATVAQDLAIGQWRVHLPFNRAKSIALTGDRIYCASERGLFYFQQSDNSVTPMSKITGLSELSVSTIRYDSESGVLVVAYTNANLDLIRNNKITNIADIKRKNMTGDKNIYGIAFRDKLAYLSCGFGIVVIDLVKNEVKDTYIIGPNGTEIAVYDIDFLGNSIFAATESGVFTADVNNSNLSNFANWSVSFPDNGNAGDYNILERFGNNLFVNYAKPNASNPNSQDDIFMYNGVTWGAPPPPFSQDITKNHSFRASGSSLCITNGYSVSVYDQSLNEINYIDQNDYPSPITRDGITGQGGALWIADNEQGLIRMASPGNYDFIFPDGPHSDLVSAIAVENSRLWMTHATRTQGWFNTYAPGNFSEFYNGDWRSYNNKTVSNSPFNIGSYFDMMSLAIDPANNRHVFIGSKGQGVVEMLNETVIASYRDTNSTLQVGIGNPSQCQAVGMGFDKNNNLWVLNSLAARPVNVRTREGEWRAFSIPGIPGAPLFGDLMIDSYGQKWINVIGNNAPLGSGLVVFDDQGTLDDETDDRARFISTGSGKGNLPSTDIRAIVEDLDNEVWLGTGKGIAVIYSPSSVITSNNFDAQQILIKQDGINQYLLDAEVVTAIAVDGANRKWIGTESGGLFLMSADGMQQIANYNESNSPILSNYIISLAIDQKTGEVFIGTNRGLISIKGEAIAGEGGCKDILVYPNPVRENYDGPIAIKGLVPNGNVKITDISGNLVYETTSLGTQAIWYGKNFKGEKAHTGVYLVFSTDEEGDNTCVTKLLLIN